MSVTFPWCDECKNLISSDFQYKCKAFPKGIPLNMLFDKGIRDKKECNNGFKFEES